MEYRDSAGKSLATQALDDADLTSAVSIESSVKEPPSLSAEYAAPSKTSALRLYAIGAAGRGIETPDRVANAVQSHVHRKPDGHEKKPSSQTGGLTNRQHLADAPNKIPYGNKSASEAPRAAQ